MAILRPGATNPAAATLSHAPPRRARSRAGLILWPAPDLGNDGLDGNLEQEVLEVEALPTTCRHSAFGGALVARTA
jgi:hypothetical protein